MSDGSVSTTGSATRKPRLAGGVKGRNRRQISSLPGSPALCAASLNCDIRSLLGCGFILDDILNLQVEIRAQGIVYGAVLLPGKGNGAVDPLGVQVVTGQVEGHLYCLEVLGRVGIPLPRDVDPKTSDIHPHLLENRYDVDRHAAAQGHQKGLRRLAAPLGVGVEIELITLRRRP